MTSIDWRIPPSTLHWLEEVPKDEPVAVLLRHSVRGPLPPGEAGNAVPITDVGVSLARQLGQVIGNRLRSLHASPVLRCVQTAEALRRGAGADLSVGRDRYLGDPGIYVVDDKRAWANWQQLDHEGVMAHLVSQDHALPGMADPDPAARFLVQHMLVSAGDRPGLHVFVTHDSIVTATAARLLGESLGKYAWPWYLEGAFFWRNGGRVAVAYKEHHHHVMRTALCSLEGRDVIDFARREVAAAIGTDCDARFFLAGGAFKTLLTGQPPRDLDLWAPSVQDRERLIETLLSRGARELDARPFGDAFEIGDRTVEVPHKVEPETLEERLARCDIAMSAVGAEHRPGFEWRVVVHPLARESVERREVLLLKPLVNWKHSLATLERARRYASEMGFRVPPEEEAEVWRVFDSQASEMQRGMLKRYDLTGRGGFGVREEVLCHLR